MKRVNELASDTKTPKNNKYKLAVITWVVDHY